MSAVALVFVGPVLFVTALMMMGKVEVKSVGLLHGILAVIMLSMVIKLFFVPPHDFLTAVILLLFVFTYFGTFASFTLGMDSKALGWYCLFVAIAVVPIGIHLMGAAFKLSILLWIYGGLWFCFWLLMGLEKKISQFVIYYLMVVAILTSVPGYLMIIGKW